MDDIKKLQHYHELWECWGEIIRDKDISGSERFMRKIEKAIAVEDNSKSITEDVRNWVDEHEGKFTILHVSNCLDLSPHRKTVGKALNRLEKDGVIKKTGRVAGEYKRVVTGARIMRWWEADGVPSSVKIPLEIHELTQLFPGEIMVMAGVSNAGKTEFCMNLASLNMHDFEVDYFATEIGKHQFKKRMEYRPQEVQDEFQKRVRVWENVSSGFEDLLNPNGINIIDYLDDADGEAYKMKNHIAAIDDALESGLAFIAIQKHKSKEFGHGGEGTRNRATIYITIDNNMAKLIKAKNKKDFMQNLDGMVCEFDFRGGLHATDVWHHPEDEKQAIDFLKRRK